MKSPSRLLTALLAAVLLSVGQLGAAKPNFIIIFTDDQGCRGPPDWLWVQDPQDANIDRIAKEGRTVTSLMVASPVCTPSRAALTHRLLSKTGEVASACCFSSTKD